MPSSWCIPMEHRPLPLGFYNLLEIQTPYFWTTYVAHQTTILLMEIPISKRVICFNYDGFLQMLLLFFGSKRPKKDTCKTCFTSAHLLRRTTTKLATSIGISIWNFQCRNLNLGLVTKVRACKGAGQKGAWESHFMLPRV